jgi:subtilisin-like proprotein convertase family protein
MKVKSVFALLLGLLMLPVLQAQNGAFFTQIPSEVVLAAEGAGKIQLPKQFEAYQLNEAALRAAVENAPWEFTPEADGRQYVITVPMGNGKSEAFAVWRVAMMDAELAAAYPEIRTYAGISMQDSRRSLRFSITPRGFRAMVMHPDLSASMIKPVFPGRNHLYVAYNHLDIQGDPMTCAHSGAITDASSWIHSNETDRPSIAANRGQELTPVRLRVFRFCVAAVGEFTQDHGGTKPLALAAVTEYTNLVSVIFERDLAIRIQLTNASQFVMFTDPGSDPYPVLTNDACMTINPSVLNQYTNINSHDIGHVFIRGGGGVAGGNACLESKARGCSAGNGLNDYGDQFLIVVGHEVGHQLSASHTWNRCGAGNDQRAGGTAFEPGSGSTIMSYGGLCGADNIVNNSNFYYHGGTLGQIRFFASNIAQCGSFIETTNNLPSVSIPYSNNFSIPISTPFELNGTGSDPDNDPLTYCWEPIDIGPETPPGQPVGNTAIFRSRPPTEASNRIFPQLSTILANAEDFSEQLPFYSRDLTFRLTVRDNYAVGGGMVFTDVAFKAVASAGPFLVLSPNSSSTIWRVGELTEVRWDVSNTNNAPVNCQKVNILLSTDGGLTYPITLAADTENDGTQYVLAPNILTSSARVRVEAADNVFFDLSNANFKIQNPVQPSLTVGLSQDGATICLPDNFVTLVNTATVQGYNTPVSLDLTGNVPPGATYTFSTVNVNPGETATFTVDMSGVTVEGNFSFTIRAISGLDTILRPVSIFLRRNDFSGFGLVSPANGLTELALSQTLRWSKGLDADTYDVQFSDSPAFTTILASANITSVDSLKINFLLEKGKAYFWRVRPRNECGVHDWTEPYFFSTFAENCLNFQANDLPKQIPANGTPVIESKINVVFGGQISDIVISQINGYHEYFKDLEVHLISPQGTEILLFKDRCGNFNGGFNFGLSDAAPSGFACPPPNNGSISKPQSPLAPLLGQNSAGLWTLRVRDKVSTAGGNLSAFALQFCQSVEIQPPFLVNNLVMPLPSGANRAVTPDFLLVEDPNNTHGQLIFTLLTVPERGILELNGIQLNPGSQFTQADIDAGSLRFFDYGINTDPDGFRFMVTDGEGGFFGTPKFIAQPLVNANDLTVQKIDFNLAPNPATQTVWLSFSQPITGSAQVRMYNIAGQLLLEQVMVNGQERLQMEVASLPKGIYVVQVETESGVGVRKLVVE